MSFEKSAEQLKRLLTIMSRLRAANGCPWDAVQTPETLRPYLLEECYEVLEAIDSGQPSHICEELGDLLLQIVFHGIIQEERGAFRVEEIIRNIADKLERRHPHVFGNGGCARAADLVEQWEAIKKLEKPGTERTLGSITSGLPALMQARKLTERASRAGFQQSKTDGAMEKVRAQLAELETALKSGDSQAMETELGDLLLAVTDLGRHLDIDAEQSLRKATTRFVLNFEQLENLFEQRGQSLREASPATVDKLWQKIKSAN